MKLIVALIVLLSITGCSQLVIVKDCAKVNDDSTRSVCRQLKPWE